MRDVLPGSAAQPVPRCLPPPTSSIPPKSYAEDTQMARIRKIVVHCSDSPDNLDIGAREIHGWHVRDRGWTDIGYHYVVRRSGTVELGRYHNGDSVLEGKEIGAHVKGQNSDALAICWVGRVKPRAAQMAALLKLVRALMAAHQVPLAKVYGHKELAEGKTCPNLDMDDFRDELRGLAAA